MATASLLCATAVDLGAAISGLGRNFWIPSLHWALLAAATLTLCSVVVARPEYFRVRDFRLAGVTVVGTSLLLLVPLPWLVRRYNDQVPKMIVLSIAGGLLAMAFVFFVAPRRRVAHRLPDNDREALLPFALLIFAAVIFPVWLRSLGSLPLLQLLTGRSAGVDIAVARFDALRGLQSVPLRLAVGATRNLYLMFAVGWLAAWWVTTPRNVWRPRTLRRVWLVGGLAIAVAFALVTTERAIVGQVLVVVIIAVLVAGRRALSWKMLGVLVTATLAFPLVFGFVLSSSSGGSPIVGAFNSVRRRLFFVPGDVMMQYFASFPERMDFLGGASIPKVQRLWGGSTFDLSGYIYQVAYQFDERFTGNANGSFFGVGWANFGLVGVVVWSAVVALTLVVLERTLQRLPRRTAAALRAVACVQAVLLTSADITRTLLNIGPGFLDLLLIALVLAWLEGRRSGPDGRRVSVDRVDSDVPPPHATSSVR